MPLPPPPDNCTYVLPLVPLQREEVPALVERLRRGLVGGGIANVLCDVHGLLPDLITIEALVRVRLTARRLGAGVRLRGASPRLIHALQVCGLGELFALGCEATVPVHPTAEQLQSLTRPTDGDPVVMVNLLRFKRHADGIDEGLSGAEAYARYSEAAGPFLTAVGGRLLAAVKPCESVIGPPESEWDLVLLVEYPSRAKFLEMATDPGYLKIHAHREAALADSRLIACSELSEAARQFGSPPSANGS